MSYLSVGIIINSYFNFLKLVYNYYSLMSIIVPDGVPDRVDGSKSSPITST